MAGELVLRREDWGEVGALRARMGLHLGAEQLAPPTADAAAARRLEATPEESLALCREAGDHPGAARALLERRGRLAKEFVKARLARDGVADAAVLLELARRGVRRDAEWALV
jgi:hypothetical protein